MWLEEGKKERERERSLPSIGCYVGAICWLLLCKRKKENSLYSAFSLFHHREDVVLLHALSQPEPMWTLQEKNYHYLIKKK